MLKRRVLTILVAAPLCLAAVWLSPPPAFVVLVAACWALAAVEWAHLAGCRRRPAVAAFAAGIAVLCWALATVPPCGPGLWLWAAAAAWWMWLTLRVVQAARRGPGGPAPVGLTMAAAVPTLVPAAAALAGLQALDPRWALYALGLVWAADIGAYVCGRAWGRRRLAPAISPGKTWVGFAGGLAAAGLLAWSGPAWLPASAPARPVLLGLTLLCAAVSVVGDLYISVLKRRAGVKDSGRLLPGHGGLLDRIDSLNAAAPLFYVGLRCFWS
ncbi:MAG: phosphatidate cytidylyltransferase [Gammaproteobacteria bacterium]|nr:MAG: phosphatidate cytidylyltransferase [Gammaproteobacteria bacterium]